MKDNFYPAFRELLENEGGYSNNPADPGGETMYGITKRIAVQHGYDGEMKDLPLTTARSIARSEYWDPINGDELPNEVDFQVFDAAYNSGNRQAKIWLQKAAKVEPDGDIGPATLAAVRTADPDKLILRFDAYRLLFMADLKNWPTFGRGWAKRIATNLLKATE